MIYFYTKITNEEITQYTKRKQQLQDIPEENIYIDCLENKKWMELEKVLCKGDMLCIESIGMMSLDAMDFLY